MVLDGTFHKNNARRLLRNVTQYLKKTQVKYIELHFTCAFLFIFVECYLIASSYRFFYEIRREAQDIIHKYLP